MPVPHVFACAVVTLLMSSTSVRQSRRRVSSAMPSMYAATLSAVGFVFNSAMDDSLTAARSAGAHAEYDGPASAASALADAVRLGRLRPAVGDFMPGRLRRHVDVPLPGRLERRIEAAQRK